MSGGHDASMVGPSRYARNPADAYWTPAWCTEALLDVWTPGPVVDEPACGSGEIAKVLESRGIEVVATDLHDWGYGQPGRDFLLSKRLFANCIITNPPYNLADEFVRHAIELTRPLAGSVAMFLRNEWDCASSRYDILGGHRAYTAKVVMTKRPRWSDENKASPRHNFAWFIWDHRNSWSPPVTKYAPIPKQHREQETK